MKKRIALLTPPSRNIGDCVHGKGSEYLLNRIFPKDEYCYHYIMQAVNYYNYEIFRSDYSYIIIAGSPYLYENFYNTYKYGKEMHYLLKFNKQAIKIAFGIGSVFPIYYKVHDVLKEKKFTEEINKFYRNFDLIIVRDGLANEIFKRSGLKSIHLPCPSMFFFRHPNYRDTKLSAKRKKPLLVFANPYTVLPDKLASRKKKKELFQIQQNITKKMKYFDCGAVMFDDFDVWKNLESDNYRKLIKFNSLLDLINMLKEATYLITSRLHSAIPASLLGIPSYLIPFDSRYRCAKFFNISLIKDLGDVDSYEFKDIKLDEYENKYEKLLRGVKWI